MEMTGPKAKSRRRSARTRLCLSCEDWLLVETTPSQWACLQLECWQRKDRAAPNPVGGICYNQAFRNSSYSPAVSSWQPNLCDCSMRGWDGRVDGRLAGLDGCERCWCLSQFARTDRRCLTKYLVLVAQKSLPKERKQYDNHNIELVALFSSPGSLASGLATVGFKAFEFWKPKDAPVQLPTASRPLQPPPLPRLSQPL